MEHPNSTWNNFSTRIIQRDVSYQVSSNFLNDEEQTKIQLASLGQEMKNLRSELQEHRVNALENPRQPDPNQKANKTPRGFAIFAEATDTPQAGVEKKIEMKKSRKYRTE